jgi:tetratricopeptide (TPR) repeat protein
LDFRRNKPNDALHFIQSQIDLHPESAALYLLQGEAFLKGKQTENAEHSLSRAVELDKENLTAVLLLAQAQSERSELEQAIATYQRAITIAPNNAGIYVTLGSLFESKGDWQQAQTLYQKALSIQPEHALAANNLAYLMLEHGGSVNVALTLAQTARRGLPDLPNSADTLGWAYFHNAAFSVAAPLFEDCVKKVPANQTYHYHLGLTYQKMNDATRARAEFEKTVSLNPSSQVAEQARHSLSEVSGG